MKETTDYTRPEEHISSGHSTEVQELAASKTKAPIGKRISEYGTHISVMSLFAATLTFAGHWKFLDYRANHAPETVKEYCDIGPATRELKEAIEHSKKNYLFGFNRNDFRSSAVVSELERVQIENAASQNEQLGNLTGLAARLGLRQKEIEDKNPEVTEYLARTAKISRYFVMGQTAAVEAASIGAVMFALPYAIAGWKKRKERKTIGEVVTEGDSTEQKS